MKKYYVVYASKDVGRLWYTHNVSWVVCVTEDESVAKDLCKKFDYDYTIETVGEGRNTHSKVRNREPQEVI